MPDTSLTFGPFLIGACLNMILYGVCIVQAFIYYQTYARDPKWIRYFVLYLFVLETINTGCDIGLLYEPLILYYGDQRSFTTAPLMLVADGIITVFISTPVQLFVAWRLRILTSSWFVPIVIAALSVCALVGGMKLSISVAMVRQYARFQQFQVSVIVWLAASAAADLLITAALCWSLAKRKTGRKETDDRIARILRLTIQTGLITMIFAIADLVIFLTNSGTTLNFIPDFALSKLYTNSLISTLNARDGWANLAGKTQEANALFGNTELSEMKKKQNIHVESVAATHSNLTADRIELQIQSPRNQLNRQLRFENEDMRSPHAINRSEDSSLEMPNKKWSASNSSYYV